MGPVADVVVASFDGSILVEMGFRTGFELTGMAANDLVIGKAFKSSHTDSLSEARNSGLSKCCSSH